MLAGSGQGAGYGAKKHMTGKQAADALASYWSHMPTEAVHVTGVPVTSHSSEARQRAADIEPHEPHESARGKARYASNRGDAGDGRGGGGGGGGGGATEERGEGRDARHGTDVGSGGGGGGGGGGKSKSTDGGSSKGGLPDLHNGLPPGWQQGYDSLHRLYYYNSYLGESSWTPPPGSHLHVKHAAVRKRASRRRASRGNHERGRGRVSGAGERENGESAESRRGGGAAREGSGNHDYTGRAARKDFLSFLGHMVTTAEKAHDTAEEMHRRAIAKRAKAFISGKMSAQDAHKALESYWQSVDADDEKKTHPDAPSDVAPAAVPTGVEKSGGHAVGAGSHSAASTDVGGRPRRVLNHPRPPSPRRSAAASAGPSSAAAEEGPTAASSSAAGQRRARGRTHGAHGGVSTSAHTQTLASAAGASSSSPARGGGGAQGGAAAASADYLGLPTGRSAAVPSPRQEMTSDESHLKLEGYFSTLVQNAKAKDHYDEKTALENKVLAVKRLQVRGETCPTHTPAPLHLAYVLHD